MKNGFDVRHGSPMPDIQAGAMILVRKRMEGYKAAFKGPYTVTKTSGQPGILKTIYYQRSNGETEMTTIGNFHPRRAVIRPEKM